jgi:hypothetical protein
MIYMGFTYWAYFVLWKMEQFNENKNRSMHFESLHE